MNPYALAYVYVIAGVFAVVLAAFARFGQIPTFLIYGSAATTITAVILAIATQQYGHETER